MTQPVYVFIQHFPRWPVFMLSVSVSSYRARPMAIRLPPSHQWCNSMLASPMQQTGSDETVFICWVFPQILFASLPLCISKCNLSAITTTLRMRILRNVISWTFLRGVMCCLCVSAFFVESERSCFSCLVPTFLFSLSIFTVLSR